MIDQCHVKSDARNLGVVLDDDLSLKLHVNNLCKSANYQLMLPVLSPEAENVITLHQS